MQLAFNISGFASSCVFLFFSASSFMNFFSPRVFLCGPEGCSISAFYRVIRFLFGQAIFGQIVVTCFKRSDMQLLPWDYYNQRRVGKKCVLCMSATVLSILKIKNVCKHKKMITFKCSYKYSCFTLILLVVLCSFQMMNMTTHISVVFFYSLLCHVNTFKFVKKQLSACLYFSPATRLCNSKKVCTVCRIQFVRVILHMRAKPRNVSKLIISASFRRLMFVSFL